MEKTNTKRDLVIIWTLLAISVIAVLFTKSALLFVPLFAYVIYKSVVGIINQKNKLFIAPFCWVILVCAVAIFKVTTHADLQSISYHLYSSVIK